MKKMKKMNRRLLIYFLQIKKTLFVISNDHHNLTSKFEVTDDNIRSLSYAELKAIKIIQSCIYSEQLDVARKYVDLLYQLYPFSTIINRLRILDIEDLRLGNTKLNVEPLPYSKSGNDENHIIDLSKKSDIKSVNTYLSFFKNYDYEIK